MDIFTTPREAALQQENDVLREQIRRLEWELNTRPGVREMIQGRPIEEREIREPGVRNLSIAAYCGAEGDPFARDTFRVVARYMRGPEALSYSYYVQDHEILSASDQATVLTYLHQRMIRSFADALRKKHGTDN